ncbi:DEAD/DEAH box helicase [Bacillus horti]|uniref:ATP-dependent RNA helicase DeaD n=1 Tax=Caldalkalibacillus horti TaxID=77523 RepID=A0ABT9W2A3_9BACI|nr:DEAD/DEAH box helicase [Bacillus horti]MDQ0167377.1 ATP-dependent RNA helicase DeaD [Bacillus horti]
MGRNRGGFKEFGLKENILKAVDDLYFETPTPIQQETIPLALEGKDVIGQAQTGTGKTAAFVLPMLQKINTDLKDVQGLILTPTRELAIQITSDIEELAKYMDIHAVCLHGGRDIQAQMNKLAGKVHIVVGTPGRVLDHLHRETIHFGRTRVLVLDEADKMLEMGFQEDVETIIATTPRKKQTLLFSATMPDRVKQLAHRFMHQPPHIRIGLKQLTSEKIKQVYYVVNQSDKTEELVKLVQNLSPYLCIIFVNTQKKVDFITDQLLQEGLDAKALHGGLSQNKRERLMNEFRQIKFQYLVCTDIAARGLDVEGVTHVINYDLPSDAESYVHRVGRTGRAGEEGLAISFVSPRQKPMMRKIESVIKQSIEEGILSQSTKSGTKPITNVTQNRKPSVKTIAKSTEKGAQSSASSSSTKERKESSGVSNKKVKPGYKKKLAAAKQREEQKEKRKKIQKKINQQLKNNRRKG